MARHRIHSLAFKKQVVQEYAAGATLNGLAREHDLSRNLIASGSPSARAASIKRHPELDPVRSSELDRWSC